MKAKTKEDYIKKIKTRERIFSGKPSKTNKKKLRKKK